MTSYQVSIETVKAVSGVGIVSRLVVLRPDELHDLMLSFTWSLQINTHTLFMSDSSVDISSTTAVNSPRDQRDRP